jgi:hypothetical protein
MQHKILVVDDEDGVVEMITSRLNNEISLPETENYAF